MACIPEFTAYEAQAKGRDAESWLLAMDDGTVTGWFYSPEDLQPSKRLKFIARGEVGAKRISNEELEREDAALAERTNWKEDIVGALVIGATFLGGITVLVYVPKFVKQLWRALV